MFAKRSTWLFVSLISASLLTGCGFHLKGQSGASAEMQVAAKSYWQNNPLQLDDDAILGTPLRAAIRDVLEDAEIGLSINGPQKLILDSADIVYRQTAQSSLGATTAETIRWQQAFSIQDAQGKVLSSGTIFSSRDRQVNPNALLAGSSERAEILQDMADEIARQLLERLNAFALRLELQAPPASKP